MKKILIALMLGCFSCAIVEKVEATPSYHVDKHDLKFTANQSAMIVTPVYSLGYEVTVSTTETKHVCVTCTTNYGYVEPVVSVPCPPPAVSNGPPDGINT